MADKLTEVLTALRELKEQQAKSDTTNATNMALLLVKVGELMTLVAETKKGGGGEKKTGAKAAVMVDFPKNSKTWASAEYAKVAEFKDACIKEFAKFSPDIAKALESDETIKKAKTDEDRRKKEFNKMIAVKDAADFQNFVKAAHKKALDEHQAKNDQKQENVEDNTPPESPKTTKAAPEVAPEETATPAPKAPKKKAAVKKT